MIWSQTRLTKNLKTINDSIEKISGGDYRIAIPKVNQEFIATAESLQNLCVQYEKMFEKIIIISLNTTDVTSQLDKFVEENSERMEKMANQVQDLSQNTKEYFDLVSSSTRELSTMNEGLQSIVEMMDRAVSATNKSSELTTESKTAMIETVEVVDRMHRLLEGFQTQIDGLKEVQNPLKASQVRLKALPVRRICCL